MYFLYNSIIFLLNKSSYRISEEQLSTELYSNPDYPSLLSLTDTLESLNIKYTVGKCDYNDLLKNKQLALTLFSSNFIVIQDVREDIISYYNTEENKTKKLKRELFEKEWEGTVLYLTNEETFNLSDFLANLFHKYKEWLFIIGLILLLFCIFNWQNIYNIIFLCSKIAGITFCLLLTKHHQNNNSLLKHLCKNGSIFNCDTVLNSKYSKILDVSLSDIGMVYFGTTLSILIYHNITNNISLYFLLSGISLCTSPIIAISIFYQGMVIKKWCPLCLSVMGILLIEALISIYCLIYINIPFTLHIQTIILLVSFTLLFTYVWSLWQHEKQYKKAATEARFEFLKIKKNTHIFKELLNQNRTIEMYHSNYIPIYGEENNTTVLTMVMNIYCIPCAKSHTDLIKLISLFPQKLKVRIIFTGNLENQSDSRNELSLYLLHIFNQFGIDIFEKELSLFMHSPKDSEITKNYKFETFDEQIKRSYSGGLEWIKKNRIDNTPTIFINNKELPSIYQVLDLKYFLNDL